MIHARFLAAGKRRAWLHAVALSILFPFQFAATADSFVRSNKRYQTGPNPCAIVAEDLNGDGLPEIITADRGNMITPGQPRSANNELSYFRAVGDLDYAPRMPLRTGRAPYRIAVANVDALKAPDLVVVNFLETDSEGDTGHLTLFRNLGEDHFEPHSFKLNSAGFQYERMLDSDGRPVFAVPGLTAVVVHDFDGDGYRDAVATGWSSDVLVYFSGDPNSYLTQTKTISAGKGPRDIRTADFNGDGHFDLVASMYISSEIVVWKGDGTGNFSEAARFSSRGSLPHTVQLADFNGDGRTDIAVSQCYAEDSIVIFYADRAGEFSFSVSQIIAMNPRNDNRVVEEEIRDFIVGDWNGDSRVDFAAACYASGRVCVFLNRSGGALPVFEPENYAFKEGRPRALCSADFNGDQQPDLAVALWQPDSVALLLGRAAKGPAAK